MNLYRYVLKTLLPAAVLLACDVALGQELCHKYNGQCIQLGPEYLPGYDMCAYRWVNIKSNEYGDNYACRGHGNCEGEVHTGTDVFLPQIKWDCPEHPGPNSCQSYNRTAIAGGCKGTTLWHNETNWRCVTTYPECLAAGLIDNTLRWVAAPGDPVVIQQCYNKDDSVGNFTRDYLPQYGDSLCFTIVAYEDSAVVVQLVTSTYEGIAMNAPVPLWYTPHPEMDSVRQDTICDIVPDTLSPMRLHGPFFEGDTAYFSDTIFFDPLTGVAQSLILRVQDYAAAGTLRAWLLNDPASNASEQIPFNFERFLSRSDSDSDGFSAWEEYRGFILNPDSAKPHARLDSTHKDLFVLPDAALAQDYDTVFAMLATSSFLGATIRTYPADLDSFSWLKTDTLIFITGTDTSRLRLSRNFVDYESRHFDGAAWVQDILATPPGLESFPWDAQHDTIKRADIAVVKVRLDAFTPTNIFANTYQFEDSSGNNLSAYESCNNPLRIYPGSGGTDAIVVYEVGLDRWVNAIANADTFHLPVSLQLDFKRQQIVRTILHEFGHVAGINHHCLPSEGELGM